MRALDAGVNGSRLVTRASVFIMRVMRALRVCACAFLSASSLEYEEEVTEFVEVPAPAPAAPAAAPAPAPARPSAGAGGASAKRAWRYRSSKEENKDGVEEGGAGKAEGDEENGEGGGKRDRSSEAARARRADEKEGGAAETAGASEAPGSRGSEEAVEEEGGEEEGAKAGKRGGGEKKPPARAAEPKKIKVPRVVTRTRSRPVRLQQTYTGMLEGAALEVRAWAKNSRDGLPSRSRLNSDATRCTMRVPTQFPPSCRPASQRWALARPWFRRGVCSMFDVRASQTEGRTKGVAMMSITRWIQQQQQQALDGLLPSCSTETPRRLWFYISLSPPPLSLFLSLCLSIRFASLL